MGLGNHIFGVLFRPRLPRVPPLRFMHAVLSGILAVIAIVLFAPMDTFATGDNWHDIALWFTEPGFATVCMVFALIGLLGVLSHRNAVQAVSALGVCLIHILIALSFIDSNHAGIGGWFCMAFAVEAAYVARRRIGGD